MFLRRKSTVGRCGLAVITLLYCEWRAFRQKIAPTYETWFLMAMPLHVVGLVTIHSPTTGECIELSNYYISIVIVEYLVP